MNLKLLLIAQYLLFAITSVLSQGTCSEYDTTGNAVFIMDRFGNCYSPASIALPQPQVLSALAGGGNPQNGVCQCGIFELTFLDVIENVIDPNPSNGGIGYGFNHPTEGQKRIDITCRVYSDLSRLLQPAPSGVPVRIEIKRSTDPIPSGVAGVGSTYYVEFNIPTFAQGMVAKTIISGQDPYVALSAYDPNFLNDPHGYLQINFDINFDLLATDNPPLPTGWGKLYSLVLHEATHSLGIASLIDDDGRSKFSNYNKPQVYSAFDRFLTKNGFPFLTVTGSGGIITDIGMLTTNMNNITCPAILFDGAINTVVYSPQIYSGGSSFSHFQCPEINTPFVMQAGTNETSFHMKYHTEEVSALCDLGYHTTTQYGQNVATNGVMADTRTNYQGCSPCSVVGNNDASSPSGTAFEISPLGQITIPTSSLLANDKAYGVSATGIVQGSVQVVQGNGTIGIANGSITYAAVAGDAEWIVLSYIPTNGVCNGSPTYIFIHVIIPLTSCPANAQESCNLICNGDFDNYTPIIPQPLTTAGVQINPYTAVYRGGTSNSPDLFRNISGTGLNALHQKLGFTFSPFNPDNSGTYIGIGRCAECDRYCIESFHLPLHTALQPGNTYQLSMEVASGHAATNILAVLCQEPPLPGSVLNNLNTYSPPAIAGQSFNASNLSASCPPISTGTLNNTMGAKETIRLSFTQPTPAPGNVLQWQTITSPQFTVGAANTGLDNLIVHLDLTPQNGISYYLIDNVKLIQVGVNTYNLNTPTNALTVCPGGIVTIPYTVTTPATNTGNTTINLTATVPPLSNITIIPGGDFATNGQLNGNIVLPPNQSRVVYLKLQLPIGSLGNSYTINMASNSVVGCLNASSPPTINITITTGLQPQPTIIFSVVSNTITANMQTVTVTHNVCLPATATSSVVCTLQTPTPAGWNLIGGTTTHIVTLQPGQCSPAFISIYRRVLSNIDYCNFDTEFCAKVVGSCTPTLEICTPFPLPIGTPIIIPASVGSFSAAIPTYLAAGITTQNVVFKGNIAMDLSSYTFAAGSTIRMASGVQLTVKTGNELTLDGTHVFAACNTLWRSITAETGATIKTKNQTLIEDGLYGIEAKGKAQLYIENTEFKRNYVGIYIPDVLIGNNTVNFAAFSNNLFHGPTSAPFLLSAYNGATVNTEKRSYAGILMHNQLTFSPVIASGAINNFSNMANGIVAYRSNIAMKNVDFRFSNMTDLFYNQLPRGNGIYTDGRFSGIYTIYFAGTGIASAAPIAFNNCVVGVHTLSTHSTVSHCKMTNMNTGVYIELCNGKNITVGNNNIAARQTGINLWHNSPSLSTSILNNIITVGGTSPSIPMGYAGIASNSGYVSEPNLLIQQNTITQQRANYGILLQAQTKSLIKENIISLTSGNGNMVGNPRQGIAVLNSPQANISCNNVSLTQGSVFNTWGEYVSASGDCRHTCNQFNNTRIGVEFDGDCLGSLVTRFSGNRFGSHFIGLLYSGNSTKTGDQVNQGNRWTAASYSGGGAKHSGTIPSQILESEYSVNSATNSQFLPPNIIAAIPWFSASTSTSFFDCNAAPTCSSPFLPPALVPTLREADTTIATNSTPNTPAEWSSRRMLYEKIDKNPQWKNGIFAQFYNQQSAQPIANVYAIDEQRQTTVAVDTPDLLLLQQYTFAIENVQDSIAILDSLQQITPFPSYANQREVYIQQLEQQHQTALNYTIGLYNDAIASSQAALVNNSSIATNFIVEQNEKLFNELYLQTVAIGNTDFSASQKQQLESLVYQCPADGGAVIYRARSLYQLIETKAFANDCNSLQARKSSEDTICYDTVKFVNPSLEGPSDSDVPPPSWSICKNTPNTFPYSIEDFQPSDGISYLSLFTLPIDFTEAAGQFVLDTLKSGKTYAFLVDITYPRFFSYRGNASIWLGNSNCQKAEQIYLLAPQDTVWQTDTVVFSPQQDYTFIQFESEFVVPQEEDGIYIDNLRPLVCITVPNNVSTPSTVAQEFYLHLYPNPNSKGLLNVEWANNSQADNIVLVDALGKKVAKYVVALGAIQQIDVQQLPNGYYTLLLETNERIIARAKLIIAKE